MYKTVVRALVRHGIARLSAGDATFLLRLAAPDADISFPGDNSWSTMFRPQHKSRERYATHRGIDECRAFADRFVAERVRVEIEDILVNGPPWNTRVAVRCHNYIVGDAGDDYNNRFIGFLTIRWGRLEAWEDYEDTERTAAWDRKRAST